jgi:hypothetical protein
MPQVTSSIDCTPLNEPCAQTGITTDWLTIQRLECEVHRAALIAAYGPMPADVYLSIKIRGHDFGSYAELELIYDPDYEDQAAYAANIEDGLSMWIDANFTAPVIYDDIGVMRPGSLRRAFDCIVGALVTSKRLIADRYGTPRERDVVANLTAAFPACAEIADMRIATVAALQTANSVS